MELFKNIKRHFLQSDIVDKFIYINVIFYFFTFLFTNFMVNWFALPANLAEFVSKPYTIISYAFIHQNFIHILGNLLVLYYIGNLFLSFYSTKKFINFYFIGALLGGILFLCYYFLTNKTGAPLGGASAAVMAIFVAIATKIPRYAIHLRFIGSVELWVLAAIWVGMSLLQLTNADKGSAIAHLGGATFGFIYQKQLEIGNDIGKWFEAFVNSFMAMFKQNKKSPLKTVYKSKDSKKESNSEKLNQQKIDEILDKISKSGYDNLTKEEKEFLFRSGKK